ncbi:MAG TPA: hypothetical protein VFG50_09335 [Rhodothermales bacterium]|nr:hypothetical protein [Rhodothermales bacterium]
MAVFHGSGYSMVSDAIAGSNAPTFLKQIVPAVFVHTSIHLVGLAAFGILALFLVDGGRSLIALLAVLVAADAIFAFYLGGVVAGALLLAAVLCFVLAAAQPIRVNASDVGV